MLVECRTLPAACGSPVWAWGVFFITALLFSLVLDSGISHQAALAVRPCLGRGTGNALIRLAGSGHRFATEPVERQGHGMQCVAPHAPAQASTLAAQPRLRCR